MKKEKKNFHLSMSIQRTKKAWNTIFYENVSCFIVLWQIQLEIRKLMQVTMQNLKLITIAAYSSVFVFILQIGFSHATQ